MSLAQSTIVNVPLFWLGVALMGMVIILAVGSVLVIRRLIPHHKLKTHHDVADPLMGAMAAIYAVLLAFVAVTVWENYDKSNSNVHLEANYLADLYRMSEALSPEFHESVSALLREYRRSVIEDEWKELQRGRMSDKTEKTMNDIWRLYTRYQVRNTTEEAFFDESVRKLTEMRELRRQRIMDSRAGLNPMMWFVLIMGGASTVSFAFFFGAENFRAHIMMTVLLAATITLIMFTIFEMDYPFSGEISIPSEPFKAMILD